MGDMFNFADIKILLLSGAVFILVAYVFYQIFDSTKNLKKDKILEGTKHLERKIESMIEVEKISLLKKYRNLMKELVPGDQVVNIYMVIVFALVLAYLAFDKAADFFNQVPAGLLIGFIVFTIPFILLDLFATFNRNRVRERLPHFLIMFQQTHRVTGDSLQALATIRHNIKEPIAGYVREFLRNMQKGAEYKESISALKDRTDNEVFKAFADNIYMDMEYGKMIDTELETNIKSAYSHVENYTQRITENSGNIASIGMVLLLFFTGVKRLLDINDEFMYILRNNPEGKILTNIVIVVLIIVFWLVKQSITYRDK